ncbi:MAG: copper resistance system multicopper oxidase [Dokdonella sp.]
MQSNTFPSADGGNLTASRRRFLQTLLAGGTVAGLGLMPRMSWSAAAVPGNVNVLRGTNFNLSVGELPVDFTGARRNAVAVNGSVPGPILRWREGERVTLRVSNSLREQTSIHWHGILLPSNMDGVPGFDFDGIAPGETFEYQFDVKQAGTYWYHSHSRFQEQVGMCGAIVVEPRDGERFPADRDYVVMLSDWSDENPETLYANLKKMGDYYNFNEPTAVAFANDALKMGFRNALAKRRMWNQMRMSPTDLADVSAYTYTYLINGATATDNWTGLFARGEKVRLRFINGSAMSIFDVRIPGLKMTVVATDGQDVEPVSVDEFRIAVAETYDVIVEPSDDRAYTLFAQSIDRTGFVRGTLAPRAGMAADVPAVDAPKWLTMKDMMGAMAMGAGMDHDHTAMTEMSGHDGHAMQGGSMASMAPTPKVRHARTEYGPGVDMRVDAPRTNLDDPGIGLRDNGRKVLTYADLHTIGGPLDPRGPGREIELHLTGNMDRYMWSFDGQKFSDAKPVHLRLGERVRIVLVNDTMMPHPIHLHGMWSELETPNGEFQVRKHTIMVQPAQRISYLVDADTPGSWAYHCHLLYHMEAGMFREVKVS